MVKRKIDGEIMDEVALLDYGAGNVQSVVNAVRKLGFNVKFVKEPQDILDARRLLFPGVGAFGPCIAALKELNYIEPLKQYIKADRPFLGICLGMQTLFEGSEESPGVEGLGVLPGIVSRFPSNGLAVPAIGWHGVTPMLDEAWPLVDPQPRCYFTHSYRVPMPSGDSPPWALACSEYGDRFVCAVRRGMCVGTQFHPEKSGATGLEILRRWLHGAPSSGVPAPITAPLSVETPSKRIIACLDVRSNDDGDLVVTKGDQYDVRESVAEGKGKVRNYGKPVSSAERYYEEGADEIAFLNITAFRETVLADQPMLDVLRGAAEKCFVPLTVGGGIRDYTDKLGKAYTAVEVADAYFRAGADKVSIGTDAVDAVRAFIASGRQLTGKTGIEQISEKYGRQAVVISVDPRRVYVESADGVPHPCVEAGAPGGIPAGPSGEKFVWYCCTTKGGRENSEIDVVQMAQAVEALGAGEILLNCIDRDGQNNGYELDLIRQVKRACTIPVIASSGAGKPEHFATALQGPAADGTAGGSGANAALAAGIFHRQEVLIGDVKKHLEQVHIPTRM